MLPEFLVQNVLVMREFIVVLDELPARQDGLVDIQRFRHEVEQTEQAQILE